jgi:Glycosyl transferase family 11
MVVVKLMGGLGNQMFQCALGLQLAQRKRTPLRLDVSDCRTNEKRPYALDSLNVNVISASPDELRRFSIPSDSNLALLMDRLVPYYRRRYVREPNFPRFDANIFRCGRNVYLSGYWQSEKYFLEIAPEIRRAFMPRWPLSPGSANVAQRIGAANAVSIHVRRGDYVTNHAAHAFHGLCSPQYYAAAIEYVQARITSPRFFVFSDDAEFADARFGDVPQCEVVCSDPNRLDHEDLWLMRLCKHHIVANSSFSWWGAWLNPREDKIVVAPKKWFRAPALDTRDLVPESWARI